MWNRAKRNFNCIYIAIEKSLVKRIVTTWLPINNPISVHSGTAWQKKFAFEIMINHIENHWNNWLLPVMVAALVRVVLTCCPQLLRPVKLDLFFHCAFERPSAPGNTNSLIICTALYIDLDFQGSELLTHWGRDKMAAIFQTTFSNGFSWMKIYEFRLTFHWSLFLGVQLTIFQVMACRRPGDKPLSEPLMVRLPTHICVTQPQWVKINPC